MASSFAKDSGIPTFAARPVKADRPGADAPPFKATAASVVAERLRRQVHVMLVQEEQFRSDLPDAEHRMRVAVRRLRSALRTFGPLVGPGPAPDLQGELRWLAGTLGAVRDRLVLGERLREELDRLPPEQVVGPVRSRVDHHLAAEVASARTEALAVLDCHRYGLLVDQITSFSERPPFRSAAGGPARQVLAQLVADELRRLRRHVRAAFAAPIGAQRDLAFHRVRKTAKRVRYGAETLRPICKSEAKAFVAELTTVQDILGDHQDAVMAGVLLRDLAIAASAAPGENGYTFGLLSGLELLKARADEEAFADAWAQFDHKSTWRWLK